MSDNKTSVLQERELYLLPTRVSEWSLLYAPLADALMLVSDDDVRQLADAIECPDRATAETLEIIDGLCNVTPVWERDNHVRNSNDFINLSILPNNICNFSCSYCYSAKGRSSKQLDFEKAKHAVDFFLSPSRNTSKKLTVSIFGGGEPLISWHSVVNPIITYLYQKAEQQERKITTTIITNGSIIPEGFVSACRKYAIDLVCSYEILEDVQNVQRKHFELVTGNIAELISNGIVPRINSVITEINVDRQCEMIEAVGCRFPEIHYISFEPVIDVDILDKHGFYTKFATSFLAAKSLADRYGIRLSCSALRNIDVTVDRYCAGELALCADGALSICPCVSSAEEPNYQDYVYGHVSEYGVSIDERKLHDLLSHNLYRQSCCKDCFAKWNCGGGCMNTYILNGNRPDTDYCRFMKSFLKYMLTERLDNTYIEETGSSIKEKIGEYGYFLTE